MESHNNASPEEFESKINYKFAGIDAEHSECEVDSGEGTKTTYRFKQDLGQGKEDKARLFTSARHEKITILKPANDKNFDFDTAHKKLRFFKKNNPSKLVRLVEKHKTYRVIVPYMSGNVYCESIVSAPDAFLIHFIEAVKALRKCHDAGMVVIDLKGDNIIFNPLKKRARLIDGGFSHLIGELLEASFRIKSQELLVKAQNECTQIAPECWSVIPMAQAKADPRSDIYSLGDMMRRMLKDNYDDHKNTFTILMNQIIERCMNSYPAFRPTLDELEFHLDAIRKVYSVIKEINDIEINFSLFNSEKEIYENRDLLIKDLALKKNQEEFIEACRIINVTPTDILIDKQKKIEDACEFRLAAIRKDQEAESTKHAVKIRRSHDALFSQKKNPKRLKSAVQLQVTPAPPRTRRTRSNSSAS